MAKAKKKQSVRPPSPRLPPSSLAPQVLEQAAQGWLQSAGASPSPSRPGPAVNDRRLAEALSETLQQLREEIAELRTRIDRLESR